MGTTVVRSLKQPLKLTVNLNKRIPLGLRQIRTIGGVQNPLKQELEPNRSLLSQKKTTRQPAVRPPMAQPLCLLNPKTDKVNNLQLNKLNKEAHPKKIEPTNYTFNRRIAMIGWGQFPIQ